VRLAFDLLVLAALSKELWQAAQLGILPRGWFLLGVLTVPFFLGMSGDSPRGISWNPVGSVVRTGVSLLALAIYVQLQLLQGSLWMYWGVFLAAVLVYLLGRAVGIAWKFMWALGALVIIAVVLVFLTRTR
jgi:hypothetical protein